MVDNRANEKQIVIYTDLDGTLLDRETYSWSKSLPAIEAVKAKGIPIVFCSAKTRAEQEFLRRELGITDPFIVEDGGAIYIREGYFDFEFESVQAPDGYEIIEFGLPYGEIVEIVRKVAEEKQIMLYSYNDMDAERVADFTGLDLQAAERARQREYEVQLVGDLDSETAELLDAAFRSRGLCTTHGGRFYGVMAHRGKGAATIVLSALFRRKFGDIVTVGIGDSSNDVPMLEVVDKPVLVKKIDETWESVDIPGIRRIDGIGPEGWHRFMMELIDEGSVTDI